MLELLISMLDTRITLTDGDVTEAFSQVPKVKSDLKCL